MNSAWLAHHGIKGQKWGVRRFENPDGSLTEAGKERYKLVYTPKDKHDKNKRINTLALIHAGVSGAAVFGLTMSQLDLKQAAAAGLIEAGGMFVLTKAFKELDYAVYGKFINI